MIKKQFAIYDSKAEFYSDPYPYHTTGEALRAFTETANDANSNISKHPEDFTLFEIGSYDNTSASWTPLEAKKSLGTALEYKQQ